jgi:hypothetical protein
MISDERLDKIEARYVELEPDEVVDYIPELIAEVRRLQAELAESDETVKAFENGTQEELNDKRAKRT